MRTSLLRYSTFAYRLVLLCCSFAVLYLQNNFVPRKTYEADRKEMLKAQSEMAQILTTMEERNKVNDRQDKQLEDHENRLRSLERRMR